MKYKILAKDGRAKRADVETVHGTIHTPVFMNVGTVAAIKGAVSTDDLREIGTQVELSNTYHLHVRTGDKLIKELGGLHRFMNWDQVRSSPIPADFRYFPSPDSERSRKRASTSTPISTVIRSSWDRRRACRSSQTLASTIAMAFDECAPHPCTRELHGEFCRENYKMAGALSGGDGEIKFPAGYRQ